MTKDCSIEEKVKENAFHEKWDTFLMFPSTPVGFTLTLLHKAVTARANVPDTLEVTFLCTRRHDRHKGFQHRMMSLGMLSLTSRRLRPRNLTPPGK